MIFISEPENCADMAKNQMAYKPNTISGITPSTTPVVAFVANRHYAMPLAAAISSVVTNLDKQRQLIIFVVDDCIPWKLKEKIMRSANRDRVRIEWINPSESHRNIVKSLPYGYIGRSCYYKMFITDLLGPEYPRIVYLDSDVIVEADITDLWSLDPGKNLILAAQDVINPRISNPFGLRNWRELGLKADAELFNTGVLVLNAARWREENISGKLVQYLKDHFQYIQLCDQDAMNAVFQGRWGQLDTRWNVPPYMSRAKNYCLLDRKSHESLIMRAYILHYCGRSKPFRAWCRHPRRDRFFHYLDLTAWSGWRPKKWAVSSGVFSHYLKRVQDIVFKSFIVNNKKST